MTIWFDMDGTIADLYGVEGWVDYLMAQDTTPYDTAKGMLNLQALARTLNSLQAKGFEIGIISWTSKGGSDFYNGQVALSKIAWLTKHLHSVNWDYIKIVPYGTNKAEICGEGILFDDEERNRNDWGEGAYSPEMIMTVLKALNRN